MLTISPLNESHIDFKLLENQLLELEILSESVLDLVYTNMTESKDSTLLFTYLSEISQIAKNKMDHVTAYVLQVQRA